MFLSYFQLSPPQPCVPTSCCYFRHAFDPRDFRACLSRLSTFVLCIFPASQPFDIPFPSPSPHIFLSLIPLLFSFNYQPLRCLSPPLLLSFFLFLSSPPTLSSCIILPLKIFIQTFIIPSSTIFYSSLFCTITLT